MRAYSFDVAILLLLPAGLGAQRPGLGPEVRKSVAVDAPVIALTNVTVIDGTGSAPKPVLPQASNSPT